MNQSTISLVLLAENAALKRGLDQSGGYVRRFSVGAREELRGLGSALNTWQGRLATLGVGLGASQQVLAAGRLDRMLIGLAQNAGESTDRVAELRREIFEMSRISGQAPEDLAAGFGSLIAGGLSWKESLETIKGVNVAMGVTKSSAGPLTDALKAVAANFDLDLSQPGLALKLLDQMTVGGREANAELESLSGIISRLGKGPTNAGMDFSSAIAYVEALSLAEKNPERLGTMAESTLRLFTNQNYLRTAKRATGVPFFEDDGSRRPFESVIRDMKLWVDLLTTEKQRADWIFRAFGKADIDTQRGMRALLQGQTFTQMTDIRAKVEAAAGTLNRDLAPALDNFIDQAGRLNSVIRKDLDRASQPILDAGSKGIKSLIDEDGLNAGGAAILGGGAVAAIMALVLGRSLKGVAGRLLAGTGDLAAGVATGKALEKATGVNPVFVTNWPSTGMGGIGGGATPTAGMILDRWGNPIASATGAAAGSAAARAIAPWLMRFGPWGLLAGFAVMGAGVAYREWNAPKPAAPRIQLPPAVAQATRTVSDATASAAQRTLDSRTDQVENFRNIAKALGIKNEIEINMQVMQDGRVVSYVDDPNTVLVVPPLQRGAF